MRPSTLTLKHAILGGGHAVSVEQLAAPERNALDVVLNARLAEEISRLAERFDPKVADELKAARPDYTDHRDMTLAETINAVLEKRHYGKLTKTQRETIDAGLRGARGAAAKVADLLQLDAPIGENLLLARELRLFCTREIGRIAGLDAKKIAQLEREGVNAETLGTAGIDDLVARKVVTAEEGRALGFLGALSRLSGSNFALIEALHGSGPQSVKDFVAWERADWQKLIEDNGIGVPDEEKDAASYAESLRRAVERSFPSDYLAVRIAKPRFGAEVKLVEAVVARKIDGAALVRDGDVDDSAIDTRGLSAAAKKRLTTRVAEFGRFAKTYRHLGISEVVNDDRLSPTEKSGLIGKRLDGLTAFFSNNPDLDLYLADFVDRTIEFDWTRIDEKERPHVKGQLRAMQRVAVLTDDATHSLKLMEAGYSSSAEITAISEAVFLAASGLDRFEGQALYARAYENSVAVSHLFEGIREVSSSLFDRLRPGNTPNLVNDLREIDGYAALFGDQNYCHCEHCRSLLSPSAYFVDLMKFVEDNVSKRVFVPSQTNHPLYLKRRRPDLWTLDLSCQSAETELPYIQIVNEVLTAFLESELNLTDVTAALATTHNSVTLPVNLHLEELRVYLGEFDMRLADIYRLLDQAAVMTQRERLEISAEELTLITTPDPGGVRARFGNLPLASMDLQDFMKFAGVTREEVTALLSVRALPEMAKVTVKVIEKPGDIQLFAERLKGLTNGRLDLIHRFLRLARKIGHTVAETDLLLESLQAAGLMTTLQSTAPGGAPAVLWLAPLFEVRDALGLSAEEVAAFAGPLPDRALSEGAESLYDRLFDRTAIFGISGTDADGRPIFNPQATLLADRTLDRISGPLAAGLGVSETELIDLLVMHGLDVSVDQPVDTALVTSLYRHARMARGLGVSVADLVSLVGLTLGSAPMAAIGDFAAVAELATWVKNSPFTVGLLRLVLTGAEVPGVSLAATPEAAAAMILGIQQAEETDKPALLFTALQDRYNLTTEQLETTFLGHLTTLDLSDPGIATALAASFTNGLPDTPADLDTLIKLMRELERTTRAFAAHDLSVEGIADIAANPARYGIADPAALTLSDIRTLAAYADLLRADPTLEAALQEAQGAYLVSPTLTPEKVALLATLLDAPQTLISSVAATLALPAEPLAAFTKIAEVVAVAGALGLDGFSLAKLTATDSAGLADARNVAFAAVRAKYPDDAKRAARLAALAEHTNTRRRDALTAFIIGHHATFKFKDRTDLYEFFLLDTEMSGCFSTSRVIAAISSLQSYINRCLLNLEQSDPVLNPSIPNIKVDPTWIPVKEWDWRRNYRVWEANRKVFLYPETYLDPALRHDKSHLFVALEQELLQQKITMESAEDAYKRYLAGFTELTGLRYAGAFAKAPWALWHFVALDQFTNKGEKSIALTQSIVGESAMDTDREMGARPRYFQSGGADNRTYYLFARTANDPYQYFYRTYKSNGGVWGNWIRMVLPIEADRISPAMHRGRLYVFWNDVKYKEINTIKGGDSQAGSVRFEVTTKYASLDENGVWTAVQKMPLGTLSSSREDIYFRVLGWRPDEDEQDRLKEEVYADYIRQVFRKPYATLTGDSTNPINLAYIWSQELGVNDVVYETGNISVKVGPIRISSPGTSFTVTNNQFGETRPVNVVVKIPPVTLTETGSLTILSPSECTLTVFGESFTIGVSASATAIPSTIFTTKTGVSLLRNEIRDFSPTPIDGRGSYLPLGHSARSYLYGEALLGALDSPAFFVENNYKSFTQSGRIVVQYDSGYSTLSLPADGGGRESVTLNTILTEELGETLYERGLEAFLSLGTQQLTDRNGQGLDFDGPYGQYYWELFFHIPFLIGNHCNANQKFKEAKWWYERVFNPTSPESPADALPSDHNWRFREFRNKDADTLKGILTNEEAIAAYRNDPFNPHAIAKLRHSAYQKAVVMAYVDNLIDWADVLFARDTRESVSEATILYSFARDVLGDRPVQVGECKTVDPLNYNIVANAMGEGSEFLILLENLTINWRNVIEFAIKPIRMMKGLEALLRAQNAIPALTQLKHIRIAAETHEVKDKLREVRRTLANDDTTQVRFGDGTVMSARDAVSTGRLTFDMPFGQPGMRRPDPVNGVVLFREVVLTKTLAADKVAKMLGFGRAELDKHVTLRPGMRLPAWDVTRQSVAAFCVPHNANLLDYWDRIDMQLTKIRNCQNISGVVRSLALLAPPIDPMMLVRARAAGLSLEDIAALVASPGALPAYRFTSLLPVAKQAAQMVQGFGQALLSALEKKDVEELRLLQLTHERNIQALTRSVKERQIREAREQLSAAEASLTRAEINLGHYADLIEAGLTGWEVAEQVATHTASGLKIAESVVHLVAGITYLVPQLGSPFAMKYGGQELGHSGAEFAAWTSAMAAVASQIAQSASLEARFQRREEDWRHQRKTAREDVDELTARRAAAEISLALAEKDRDMHDRAMEQTAAIEDAHKGKFTGVGLYNHMAAKLSRVCRRAYTVAHDLAKAAERAYQFETDSTAFFVAGDNWDPSRAGLMAGEQLSVQIAAMEADFLTINTRRPEIRQSFSLAMLDGGALVQLRQTGACTIRIPEVAFETLYPGQYRRLIKGVRVSIPAVVGPFTNVSARLTLLKGEVEAEDRDALTERPVAKNDAISLSGAVNDSGTFEFSHQDQRFLPFEGAGAVSEWRLELPSAIRSFDYDTITDVLIHLDYTALDGDRMQAETDLAAAIAAHAAGPGLFRLISLRHEIPAAWARLTGPAPTAPQDVDFTLTEKHFPHLLRGRDVQLSATTIYLRPTAGASVAPPALSLNGTAVTWAPSEDIARPGATGETGKLKGGTVALSGAAKRGWRFDGGAGALDPATAGDLMILIRYTAAMT